MHAHACKQRIFWSYSTPTFNAMHFDANLFTCQYQNEDRKAEGFQMLHFYLFLNKWHHDSEVVNSDDTLLAKPPSTAFPAPTFAHQTHELARQIALGDFRVRRAWGLWGCNSTRGGRVGLDGSVQHALHLTQHLSDWPALHDVLNETQTSG